MEELEEPVELSVRWIMDKVRLVTTRAQAEALIERIVDASPDPEEMLSRESSIAAVRQTIGYLTGYMNWELGERVWELFSTEHPFFKKTWPTFDEALQMGMEYGKMTPEERHKFWSSSSQIPK